MLTALEHLAGGLLCDLLDGLVEAELVVDVVEDTLADLVVLLEELLGVLAALAEPLLAVGEPRPALLDYVVLYPDVEQAALARDPLTVHHVELNRLERRRHLVLYDLDPGLVANRVGADLDYVQGEGRLTARLGAEDLHDAAPRHAAHA